MNIFNNINDWELSSFVCTHKPSGMTFWVANGWMFFDGYRDTPAFLSFIERWWYYRKFRKMIKGSL